MRLFLVRHGQTTANLLTKYTGQKDVPLTDLGRQQAESIRPVLEKFHFDAVYSSDLSRAIETQRLAIPGVEGIPTPLIREIDVGNIVDREIADVRAENPGWVVSKDPEGYRRFGGESVRDVWDRVGKFLEMVEQSDCENVIAFAHTGTIAVMISYIIGKEDINRSVLRSNNCAIHILEKDEKGWCLKAWNYMGKL